ncbi:MAG: glucose-1-phosphate cytidylyltransferase, partial [Pseudomonadota bacterium]
MKVGILAGGYGSRLAEETDVRPKPMVEIGGRPILWHIMKIYYAYGLNDFAVALGYKGDYIKRWFRDYSLIGGHMRVETGTGSVRCQNGALPNWNVDLVDTGLETMTGGRIKRLHPWLGDETFMMTWGDGVADIDLDALLKFHRRHGKLATMTAVRPPARYGHIVFDGDQITEFSEKPQVGEGWINGAFFVLEPGVHEYIDGDHVMFEHAPLQRLAKDGQLMAYRHESFWQCMDTLREKRILEDAWATGEA